MAESVSPWIAALYGLIQGLTEFLPVSSSGHLRLAHRLGLGNLPPEQELVFDVMLHGATLIAIVLAFRREIFAIRAAPPRFFAGLALSVGPAGLVGLGARGWVSFVGSRLNYIGICFLVNAVMLSFGSNRAVASNPRDKVDWQEGPTAKQGLAVGLMQVMGLLPGISRSGSCLAAGLISGMKPASAVAYAFVVGLPLLAGAAGRDVLSGETGALLAGLGWAPMLAGAGTALASGWAAALILRRLVLAGKLSWFAAYSAGLGLACFFL